MLIPNTIEIAGHIYEVQIRDDPKKPLEFGYINFHSCEIRISEHISATQKEATLVHEILEAINSTHRIDLTHKQIERLEAGLYPVIKKHLIWRIE